MVNFKINGISVTANDGESIWQVAKRYDIAIPHLCHADEVGYDPDGNCRACVVQIDKERTLAASCIRKPKEGMDVNSVKPEVTETQKVIFELLAADQPDRLHHPDPDSKFWNWCDKLDADSQTFPKNKLIKRDISHPSMHVNLEACINCNLCVRACREVQSNDVIGMGFRGHKSKVIFDLKELTIDTYLFILFPSSAIILINLSNSSELFLNFIRSIAPNKLVMGELIFLDILLINPLINMSVRILLD